MCGLETIAVFRLQDTGSLDYNADFRRAASILCNWRLVKPSVASRTADGAALKLKECRQGVGVVCANPDLFAFPQFAPVKHTLGSGLPELSFYTRLPLANDTGV